MRFPGFVREFSCSWRVEMNCGSHCVTTDRRNSFGREAATRAFDLLSTHATFFFCVLKTPMLIPTPDSTTVEHTAVEHQTPPFVDFSSHFVWKVIRVCRKTFHRPFHLLPLWIPPTSTSQLRCTTSRRTPKCMMSIS